MYYNHINTHPFKLFKYDTQTTCSKFYLDKKKKEDAENGPCNKYKYFLFSAVSLCFVACIPVFLSIHAAVLGWSTTHFKCHNHKAPANSKLHNLEAQHKFDYNDKRKAQTHNNSPLTKIHAQKEYLVITYPHSHLNTVKTKYFHIQFLRCSGPSCKSNKHKSTNYQKK